MRIVKAKVRGQANVLKIKGQVSVSQELVSLSKAVRSGDPSNIEALAARTYWHNFLQPGGSFSRQQSSSDFVNAMLNYGYTILRGRVITRLVTTGLSPTLSLFHRNRSNMFALADDLIEPFRPAVDSVVLDLVNDGSVELGKTEKKRLSGVLAEQHDESSFTVRSLIEDFCQEFALYVEGTRENLNVPIWNGREITKDG
ncbi:hypothetical protein GCM10007359_16850 [Rothia aerolata]|uniref:CRISPR-associated endonuclease Cas1 n=2 Tax=Rothia aerolata TaxID=1812262 RepID=A0A917MW97_9MICC|nr:hypothetical protein GCM10007359_16850 [Rothia aerolata]